MAYQQQPPGYQPAPPAYNPYAGPPQGQYQPAPQPGYQPAQQQQSHTNVVVVQQQPQQVSQLRCFMYCVASVLKCTYKVNFCGYIFISTCDKG